MLETDSKNNVWEANFDSFGRVLVPAALRHELDIEPGASLFWVRDESGLRLQSYEESLKEIQAYYQGLAPAEEIWSDEIIQRRRQEAAGE